MKICKSVADLRVALAGAPRPVGFVPTMGALHDGSRVFPLLEDPLGTVRIEIQQPGLPGPSVDPGIVGERLGEFVRFGQYRFEIAAFNHPLHTPKTMIGDLGSHADGLFENGVGVGLMALILERLRVPSQNQSGIGMTLCEILQACQVTLETGTEALE